MCWLNDELDANRDWLEEAVAWPPDVNNPGDWQAKKAYLESFLAKLARDLLTECATDCGSLGQPSQDEIDELMKRLWRLLREHLWAIWSNQKQPRRT